MLMHLLRNHNFRFITLDCCPAPRLLVMGEGKLFCLLNETSSVHCSIFGTGYR